MNDLLHSEHLGVDLGEVGADPRSGHAFYANTARRKYAPHAHSTQKRDQARK